VKYLPGRVCWPKAVRGFMTKRDSSTGETGETGATLFDVDDSR
jgi:hypothetical protein